MCKLESRNLYFSVLLNQNSRKYIFFVKGENLSVPLPMLWTGFNTAVVYKITKNVSFPLRKISIRVTMIDISILSYMIQANYMR